MPNCEAPEEFEADHAAHLEAFGFLCREIERECGLIAHAHAADRYLAHLGISTGRYLLSGARRRRLTLRCESQCSDRGWRQDGVPAGIDNERERSFAVDQGIDEDVIVRQADRHRRTDRTSVDGCASGRFDWTRIRGQRTRGLDVESRQLHRLEPGGTGPAVDGDGVRHHHAVLPRKITVARCDVEELLRFVDSEQKVRGRIEPRVEGFAATRTDPQVIRRDIVDRLAALELDDRSAAVRAPPQVGVAIRFVGRNRQPISAVLRRVRA